MTVAGFLLAIWAFTLPPWLGLTLSGIVLLVAAGFAYTLGWPKNRRALHEVLHKEYPQFEYSLDLLQKEHSLLSLPERLQQERIAKRVSEEKKLKLPVRWLGSFGILCLGLLLYVIGFNTSQPLPEEVIKGAVTAGKNNEAEVVLDSLKQRFPALNSVVVQASPPSYTGRRAFQSGLEKLEAPEGSRITWLVALSEPANVWLRFANGDSLVLQPTKKGTYSAQIKLNKDRLYQLWMAKEKAQKAASPYIHIKALPDVPPAVSLQKEGEAYVRTEKPDPFTVELQLQDDYGLNRAYLLTTISRGSGEGVKFMEEKHWLDISKDVKSHHQRFEIKPKALGMEVGDELYYRLVAFDNHPPTGQEARSSTYFLKWIDTTQVATFETQGMAMDIMPEYFRSQRQIIIDTEKLLEEQPGLAEEEFGRRSNGLGADQKILRLRYGKFLGEEFESDAGIGHQHEHDEEEEEGHVEIDEHEGGEQGEHPHALETHEDPVKPAGSIEGLEAYMHTHDIAEAATFYEETIKVKLKAALAQMWESELRLRTLRPEEALPYQYEALRIVKDLQQSTRIYVERIGFEPPALRFDKRLSGEGEDISARQMRQTNTPTDSLEQLYTLRNQLQQDLLKAKPTIAVSLLEKAGRELAGFSLEFPSPDVLEALRLLRQWQENNQLNSSEKDRLLQLLSRFLPPQPERPVPAQLPNNRIVQAFTDSLTYDH